MIEHCPIDRHSLDVHFCGSPLDLAELMRMLERVHARLACRFDLLMPPLAHPALCVTVDRLIVDQCPEWSRVEPFLESLRTNRGGSARD